MRTIAVWMFVFAFAALAAPVGSTHAVVSSTAIHVADGGYPPPPPICPGPNCYTQPSGAVIAAEVTTQFADGGYPPPPPCAPTGCTLKYVA